jgi:glutamate-1-semialdehyde 2,1-aminomutase
MVTISADQVKRDIIARYEARTPQSGRWHLEARKVLPGGETRESTAYDPYPAVLESGQGCRLVDIDGNEYLDFLGNYTSLVHGHCDPDITAAVRAQLEKGSMLGSVSIHLFEHARLLCERLPSVDMVRYTNSGTEAVMWAIRAARAVTRKDMILKMEGAYHGTCDIAKISLLPDINADGAPQPHIEGLGVPQSVLQDVVVAPFNDPDTVETLLKTHRDRLAAVLVEPFLGGLGVIPPQPGYLAALRELTKQYDVLLIFDEVQAFRLSTGGIQQMADVYPDITATGKVIGGGYPVGAFGGSREIMDRFEFDLANPDAINHSGTFNGNEVTMAAGIASIIKLDEKRIDHINRLGARLREKLNDFFRSAGIRCQMTGIGSLSNIFYTDTPVTNVTHFVNAYLPCVELQRLFHLELINRGIYTAKRGEFVISTPMTEADIDRGVEVVKDTFSLMKPYLREKTPHLL